MALAPPLVRAKQRNEAAKAIVVLRISSTQLLSEATKDERQKARIGSPSEMDALATKLRVAAHNLQADLTVSPFKLYPLLIGNALAIGTCSGGRIPQLVISNPS
jgi:hypothetical protein